MLAAFGREELGRYIILKDLHLTVVRDGQVVTRDDIEAACEDHVAKQERGGLSTVQQAMRGSGLGELINQALINNPQSEEYRQAHAQLEEVERRQGKGFPKTIIRRGWTACTWSRAIQIGTVLPRPQATGQRP